MCLNKRLSITFISADEKNEKHFKLVHQKNGNVHGPYNTRTLKKLAYDGTVSKDTLIRLGEKANWGPARDLPFLKFKSSSAINSNKLNSKILLGISRHVIPWIILTLHLMAFIIGVFGSNQKPEVQLQNRCAWCFEPAVGQAGPYSERWRSLERFYPACRYHLDNPPAYVDRHPSPISFLQILFGVFYIAFIIAGFVGNPICKWLSLLTGISLILFFLCFRNVISFSNLLIVLGIVGGIAVCFDRMAAE